MVAKMRPEDIAAALRAAVRERVFLPGQALNQDDLARRFGVSRIPLREALRTLVGEGLILMKPGLGAVVAELQAEEVSELYGLRLHLEPPLAPHIVHHMRRRDHEDLAALVDSMASLGQEQSEEWSNLNYRFHRRMYELSERRHTVRLIVQVLNLVEPYARVHAHVLGSRPKMQQQRADVVEALRAEDVDRVGAVITESIDVARTELLASMNDQRPNPHDPVATLRS
jgi:DNA-binding GntR family transcriptional regulator